MYDHAEIITMIAAHPGVDINILTVDGFTPLMLAAVEGKSSAVEALLAEGAITNYKDPKSGKTAMEHASEICDDLSLCEVLKVFEDWGVQKNEL
jgi:ankyrin repeat protein